MTTLLHVLSRSPFSHTDLSSCLALLSAGDGLLLTGDAVYALQAGTLVYEQLHQLPEHNIPLFALDEDCQARQIVPPVSVERVSYPRFVELCCQFSRVNTWL